MIDWMRLCADLRQVFGTMTQVSRLIHRNDPDNITRLERGTVADPRHALGVLLIDLYRQHINEEIPMVGAMQQKRLV